MSNLILKPDPDSDLYVVWGTIPGGPTAWGTRVKITQDLAEAGYGNNGTAERFERADRTGTSRWSDTDFTGMVVHSPAGVDGRPGWIPRERMIDWLHSGLDPAHLEPIADQEQING